MTLEESLAALASLIFIFLLHMELRIRGVVKAMDDLIKEIEKTL